MKTLQLAPLAAILSALLVPAALADHGNGNGNHNNNGNGGGNSSNGSGSNSNDDDDDTNTTVVSPSHLQGWVFSSNGAPEGSLAFVVGPGTAPLGEGSLALSVTDALQRVVLANGSYAGTRLDALAGLTFSTYRISPATGALAPSLQLDIDFDLTDTTTTAQGQLVFDPAGTTPVTTGVWQEWDALAGKWYMTGTAIEANVPAGQPFPAATAGTLAQILAEYPHAGIRATIGNVSLRAGGPGGAFSGNVDALTIGIDGGDSTTFDFEPDSDGDTVPDAEDECPDSDFSEFVDVGMGNTTIINSVDDEGCTIMDLVNAAADNATNHGKYVSAIAKLADRLKKAGTITKNQSREMKTGAAHSTVGK